MFVVGFFVVGLCVVVVSCCCLSVLFVHRFCSWWWLFFVVCCQRSFLFVLRLCVVCGFACVAVGVVGCGAWVVGL